MKHKHWVTFRLLAAVPLLIGTLGLSPALADDQPSQSDGKVVGQINLPSLTVTDLFLRTSGTSRAFLYIAYNNRTISLIDVTDPAKPKKVDELNLNQGSSQTKLRPVGPNGVVATAAPDPSQQLTVITGNATPVVAKQFSKVAAYTIDSGRNLVFVIDKNKLSIFKFDHPVSKDAEIVDQQYKAR